MNARTPAPPPVRPRAGRAFFVAPLLALAALPACAGEEAEPAHRDVAAAFDAGHAALARGQAGVALQAYAWAEEHAADPALRREAVAAQFRASLVHNDAQAGFEGLERLSRAAPGQLDATLLRELTHHAVTVAHDAISALGLVAFAEEHLPAPERARYDPAASREFIEASLAQDADRLQELGYVSLERDAAPTPAPEVSPDPDHDLE